jgi:Flp pilus assembly protein TadD
VNLGLAEAARGDPGAALEAFEQALAREPDEPAIHTNRASILLQLGREEEAQAEVARALELDPAHAAAWNLRGVFAERRGDPAGARWRPTSARSRRSLGTRRRTRTSVGSCSP